MGKFLQKHPFVAGLILLAVVFVLYPKTFLVLIGAAAAIAVLSVTKGKVA